MKLGADVFVYNLNDSSDTSLAGSAGEDFIRSLLDVYWSDDFNYNVTNDFVIPLAYTVGFGLLRPGSRRLTMGYDVTTTSDINIASAPSSLTLLGVALVALGFAARHRCG